MNNIVFLRIVMRLLRFVGESKSYVGLIISYVGVSNSYVGLIICYVGVTYYLLRRSY